MSTFLNPLLLNFTYALTLSPLNEIMEHSNAVLWTIPIKSCSTCYRNYFLQKPCVNLLCCFKQPLDIIRENQTYGGTKRTGFDQILRFLAASDQSLSFLSHISICGKHCSCFLLNFYEYSVHMNIWKRLILENTVHFSIN